MWELFWDKQNTEGYDPEIQTEDFEFYNYYAMDVHKSRVMRIKGMTAPSFLRPRLRGSGIFGGRSPGSLHQPILEIHGTWASKCWMSSSLTFTRSRTSSTRFCHPMVSRRSSSAFSSPTGRKNYQNAVVMDSEDDFDHKQLSFAGLAEAMAGIRMQVAADMRMPITKLFAARA